MYLLSIIGKSVFARCICALSIFAVGILIARYFGKEGVGIYVFTMAARRLIFSLSNLGYLSTIVYNFTSDFKMTKNDFLNLLYRVLLLVVFSISFVIVLCHILPNDYVEAYLERIYLISVLVVSLFFLTFSFRVASVLKKTNYINAGEVTVQLSFLTICSSTTFLNFDLNVDNLLLLFFIIELFVAFFLVLLIYHSLPNEKFNRKEIISIKSVFRYSKWVYVSNWVNNLIIDYPVFAMSLAMLPSSAIGVFSRAMTFINLGRSVINPLSTILFPFFRKKESNVLKNFFFSIFITVISLLPVSIFVYVFSKEIISFFYGEEFVSASLYLEIMAPVLFLQPFNVLSNVFLVARGKAKSVSFFSALSLLTLIVCSFSLYFDFGVSAFAISILIQQLTIAFIYLVLVLRTIVHEGLSFNQE